MQRYATLAQSSTIPEYAKECPEAVGDGVLFVCQDEIQVDEVCENS